MTFNDTFMQYVWPTTFVFIAISTFVYVFLIVMRIFVDRKGKVHDERRVEMEECLLIHLSNPLSNIREVLIKNPKMDMKVLAAIAGDMFRMVKGSSYEKLRETLKKVGFYDWIILSLQGDDVKQCLSAVQLAKHWVNDSITPKLVNLLMHHHPSIRYSAMISLACTQNKMYFRDVVTVLESEEALSHLMVYDIFRQFGATIKKDLESLLKQKKSTSRLQSAAILSLGNLGDKASIHNYVAPYCLSENTRVRLLAFQICGNNGVSLPVDVLQKGLADTDANIRMQACVCARHHHPLPLEFFDKALSDKNWLVALQAAHALFNSGSIGQSFLYVQSQRLSVAGKRAAMFLEEKG